MCTILNIKSGQIFSYGITESNEKIKVLSGHIFYEKTIEVEKYDDNFYSIKKLDYNEELILDRYVDDEGLIGLAFLNEDLYVSKPFNRIYQIEGYWFFVPKKIIHLVEYLYNNNLTEHSKIKITKSHTTITSRAPIINVNYDRLFNLVTERKKPINAHFYCERKKEFDNNIYADFYVLGVLKNNELQLELWEIIGDGEELYYSHFIHNVEKQRFNHFDLATHIKDPDSNINELLNHKMKPNLIQKTKWFRNDSDLKKEEIFDLTKLFFPLEKLIDEFSVKNYG